MSQFWIKHTPDGESHGPYSAEELRRYAVEGRIRPDSLVSKDQSAWHPAGEVKGMFPEARRAAPPPPMPPGLPASAPPPPADAEYGLQPPAAPAPPPAYATPPIAVHTQPAQPSAPPPQPGTGLGYYVNRPQTAADAVVRRRSVLPFVCVAIAMFVVGGVLTYMAYFPARGGTAGPLPDNVMYAICTSALFLLLAVAALVLWLMWVHAAHRDLQELNGGPRGISPGQAVGFSFIPIFDAFWAVYMPSRLAQETNRHLAARQLPTIATGAVITCQIVSVLAAVFLPGLAPVLYAVSMWQVQSGLNRLAA